MAWYTIRERPSERKPPTHLERSRATGSEHLRRAVRRLPEGRRVIDVVAVAAKVRDVEDVEHLDEHAHPGLFAQVERLRHAQILRAEAVAKLVVRRQRQRRDHLV